MLDNVDFVSSEEHRFKELPIEARHSICLEISKKRRQRVATSIFIPKELSNHIRFLKKCQRRDSNKKTKIKKSMTNDRNSSTNILAKYKNKYLKRRGTTKAKQKSQQPKPACLKHPESYPIPNKYAQTFTSERLHSLLELLREENASKTIAPKQLEIVEQQIPLGTDQNLTISFAVEVPETTTTDTTMATNTVTDVTNTFDVHPATDSVTNENFSTLELKQEVLDSSYEYVESETMQRNFDETENNTYPIPYAEPVVNNSNNNISQRGFIEDSHPLTIDDNVQQLPQVSQLENNNIKQADYNILNSYYCYHQAPEASTKQLASSVENLELQLLRNYQSVVPQQDLGHNNRTSYTTPTNSYMAPTIEHSVPQSINFYHRQHDQHRVPDPCTNNAINCNNAQIFQNQSPQQMAMTRQASTSCRHNLHKRHQHYLGYGLNHNGSGLEDPLAFKAWQYTMHKAQVHSRRAQRPSNAASQLRLQPSIEATGSWHYPSHGGNGFASVNTTTHPYHTLSVHPRQAATPTPLTYVPPVLPRVPPNYCHNAGESFTNPVDLTMYAYYQQSQLQREPPPPYRHHYHQQPQQTQYYTQQQHSESYQPHELQQQPHYHHPQIPQQQQQQLVPTHPSTSYVDSLTASYHPAQLKRLSQAFAHISSTVLPHHATDPSYWYQLQRDLLFDQRNAGSRSANLRGIITNGPALGHAGTYVSNSLF